MQVRLHGTHNEEDVYLTDSSASRSGPQRNTIGALALGCGDCQLNGMQNAGLPQRVFDAGAATRDAQ